MNTFKEVLEPLAEVSVPSLALAGDKFGYRAVDAHEEDIVWRQEVGEESAPLRELDDVIDDEIVARLGNRGETAVETVEETRPDLNP